MQWLQTALSAVFAVCTPRPTSYHVDWGMLRGFSFRHFQAELLCFRAHNGERYIYLCFAFAAHKKRSGWVGTRDLSENERRHKRQRNRSKWDNWFIKYLQTFPCSFLSFSSFMAGFFLSCSANLRPHRRYARLASRQKTENTAKEQ